MRPKAGAERDNRIWYYAGGALLAAFILWHFLGSDDRTKKLAQPPVVVSMAKVKRQDVPIEVREVGTVIPYETVSIRSRLDSQLAEVKFHDGDEVQKGDLLFILDDRTLKAELLQADANVNRDRAQLENLRLQYVRSKNLTGKGYVSQASMDEARATFEAQKASLGATEASLQNIRTQLSYTQITAPISGRTGTINVTTGNTVKANDTQPLVTINQIKPIRVQTALAQNYFDAVRNAMNAGGVKVTAMREGVGKVAEGMVEYIDNAVDSGTGSFITRARFANEDEQLWPGMFVTLVLQLGDDKQVLVVPEEAIQHGQSGDFLFVLNEGIAEQRNVKLLRMQNHLAVIAEGVKEGEHVATDGILSLKNGSKITLRDEKPKTQKAGT